MTILIEPVASLNYSTTPLNLTPVTSPAELGTPIIGYQGVSVAPTAITTNSLTTTLTAAGMMINLVPIAATYPLASSGSICFAVNPTTAAANAAMLEFGVGIGNPNGTGSGAMAFIGFAGAPTAKGLVISINGTQTTIDANYTASMAFMIVLNLATGALQVITPNGTFSPVPTAPMGASTTISLLSMIDNSTAVSSTVSLAYATAAAGTVVNGLTAPAGTVQLTGEVSPSLPTGYVLGDRYQVTNGGVLIAPNGVKYNIATNAIIEVIGTTAQPEINITSFYQQSDIASIANTATTPSSVNALGLAPNILTPGIYHSDISPIEFPVSTTTASLNRLTPMGSVVSLTANGPIQLSSSAVDNLVKAGSAKFGTLADPFGLVDIVSSYVNGSNLWDSTLIPAIPTDASGASWVFEFRYKGEGVVTTTLTESVIGIFSPMNNTGGQRSYVSTSNYNAAPVGAHNVFAYLDLIAGTFVLNQNPSAITSGSTSTTTVISGLSISSLALGDVFTFVVSGSTITIYKNGISIVASTSLSFTADKDIYLAPFGLQLPASNGVWSMNSGQLPFIYYNHAYNPVPLIDQSRLGITTGTINSTAPTFQIDTRLDPSVVLTLSNSTGAVTLLNPTGSNILSNLYLDEINVVVTGALTAGTSSVLTLNGNITDVYYNGTVGYYTFRRGGTTGTVPYTLVAKEIVHPDSVVIPAVWNATGTTYTASLSAGVEFYEVDLTNGSGSMAFSPLVAGVYPSKVTLKVMQSASALNTLTFAPGVSNSSGWTTATAFQNVYDIPAAPYTVGGNIEPQYLEFIFDPINFIYRFVQASPKTVAVIIPMLYPSGGTPGTINNGVATLAKASVESVQFSVPITSAFRQGHTVALALQFTTTVYSGNVDLQVSYQITPPSTPAPTATVVTEVMAAPITSATFVNHITTTAFINLSAGSLGSMLMVVLTRLSTNALDTCTGDMQLNSVTLVQ